MIRRLRFEVLASLAIAAALTTEHAARWIKKER